MCSSSAKEEIDAFKVNVTINIQKLVKIITAVIWEINHDEFNNINQMADRIAKIVHGTVRKILFFKYGFLQHLFSKIGTRKHLHLQRQRNENITFFKEHNIDILTLNETWLKSKFKLNILNYTITRSDRSRMQRRDVA